MKSKDWLNRNKRDFYVKKAKKQGYLSRAAYKLIEIENKFNFIANSKKILELGAAPGGWSQVALEINPKIEITAIDIFINSSPLDTLSPLLKSIFIMLPVVSDLTSIFLL